MSSVSNYNSITLDTTMVNKRNNNINRSQREKLKDFNN